MKKNIIILLSLCYINTYGQKNIIVNEVKNVSLVSTLCSVDTVIFKNNNAITVVLYKISNPSNSARLPETEQVTNKFLIAVANGDEVPEKHLFSIGDFYNPKILKWENLKDKYLVFIEYGIYSNRKKIAFNIALNKVTIVGN